MRRLAPVLAVAGTLVLAPPAVADAPRSLGEVAEKTKEKKKTGKVFTEADLGRAGAGTVSRPGAVGTTTASPAAGEQKAEGATPAAAADGTKPKTPEEERAEREKAWRDRLEKARADVARESDAVARLQNSLNDRSGPIYGAGRQARVQALEDAKRFLATAQQQVADLEAEGRTNGFK